MLYVSELGIAPYGSTRFISIGWVSSVLAQRKQCAPSTSHGSPGPTVTTKPETYISSMFLQHLSWSTRGVLAAPLGSLSYSAFKIVSVLHCVEFFNYLSPTLYTASNCMKRRSYVEQSKGGTASTRRQSTMYASSSD